MNVLFLCSDEHSPHALGCYGNNAIQTPHLDALASRGITFSNAYCASPICCPSRASLATGRYIHRLGTWDNATPYDGTQADSWGHRLQAQGYPATTFGKLHYEKTEGATGFDERNPIYFSPGSPAEVYGLARHITPDIPKMRQHVLDASAREVPYTAYDRKTCNQAVHWLKDVAPYLNKPWATFVSFAHPHFPFGAPAEFVNKYSPDKVPFPIQGKPEEWANNPAINRLRKIFNLDTPLSEAEIRNAVAVYYGMVSFMDDLVGQVITALYESGLSNNTLILYTSDHGEMHGEHGLWYKGVMYESSVRVPLIVAGPGIPVGKVSRTPVSHVDIYPTIIQATGADDAEQDTDLPGASLLQTSDKANQNRAVFSEFHGLGATNAVFMIRTDRWKYNHYVGFPPQLFDMQKDPDEVHNLADNPAYADTLQSCRKALFTILDPDKVDAEAKRDQLAKLEQKGGLEKMEALLRKDVFTPPPGEAKGNPS